MEGGNGGRDGGEKGGREGEGVSKEGRKVYFNQGRREGEGACNLFWYMYVRNLPAVKGCVKPSRMCTCVLYNDSCSPILLKVPTLWGSFEIKNVRLAKIMLRQLLG